MRGLVFVALIGCGDNPPDETRQGGDTTVDDRTQLAYLHHAANLTPDEQARFQAGKGPFDFHWEQPQLGPQFSNDACFGCHGSNGRGLSQIGGDGVIDINGPQSEAFIRVSVATGAPDEPGGPVPVPGLGLQLRDHATIGVAEVIVVLTWLEHQEEYGDGEGFALRVPSLAIRIATGGTLPVGTLQSYRHGPALIGLGLLEAVDEATLHEHEDPDDANGDGISGRLNHVWDPNLQVTTVGRFGWKGNVASLYVQTAGAAVRDIGLTNKLFPEADGTRDIQDDQLDAIAFMVSTIAVPAAARRDGPALRGRQLFDDFHCSSCHLPTLVTGDHPIPAVAHQTIHPYTDMLLHDMGDRLDDQRPDFLAQGNEWRTPALWGVGLAQLVRANVTFLHDGRARTLAEAILWHGGEAMDAREAFRTATKADRDALIAFLGTL